MTIKHMIYTKDNGDTSSRKVIVVSSPRKNYLMYDVSALSEEALSIFTEALNKAEDYRNNCIADFELVTGIKQANLWRSFKPEGIEWVVQNEEIQTIK